MNKIQKSFLRMAVFFLMLLLTGCGSTLSTELSISDNFSGTREMEVSISKADFEEYVSGGDFETIAEDTKVNTPECMEFSYEETEEENYVFRFLMSFGSKEEYESQIASILGNGYTVEFLANKSPFAKGVSLKEDFSSGDLLSFLKEYLVAGKYIKEEAAPYVFEYTKNSVTVNGKTYISQNDKLNVSEKTYVEILRINLFTDIDAVNEKIARKIEVVFESKTLAKSREEVESYLQKITPDGCRGEWSKTEDGLEIYTVVTPACTQEEMTYVMQTFCESSSSSLTLKSHETSDEQTDEKKEDEKKQEDLSISFSDVWDTEFITGEENKGAKDSKDYVQPFGYDSILDETLDLKNFVCDSWGEIDSYYYISTKNGKPESMIYTPDGEEIYGWDYIDSSYPDYYYVETQWRPEFRLTSQVNKCFVPSSVELSTTVKSEKKVTREFVFYFNSPFEEPVAEKIIKKMDSLFEGKEDLITVTLKNGKKDAKITWKIKGSADETDRLCDEIFGTGYSNLKYYEQGDFVWKKGYEFAETLDLGAIFDWEYAGKIDYTLKMPGKIEKENASVSGGVGSVARIDGKCADYLSTESGYLNVRLCGSRTNSVMAVLIIVIICTVIAVIGGIFVFVIGRKKKKH